MNYIQLTKERKAQIDILLEQGLSMRKTTSILELVIQLFLDIKLDLSEKKNKYK